MAEQKKQLGNIAVSQQVMDALNDSFLSSQATNKVSGSPLVDKTASSVMRKKVAGVLVSILKEQQALAQDAYNEAVRSVEKFHRAAIKSLDDRDKIVAQEFPDILANLEKQNNILAAFTK